MITVDNKDHLTNALELLNDQLQIAEEKARDVVNSAQGAISESARVGIIDPHVALVKNHAINIGDRLSVLRRETILLQAYVKQLPCSQP